MQHRFVSLRQRAKWRILIKIAAPSRNAAGQPTISANNVLCIDDSCCRLETNKQQKKNKKKKTKWLNENDRKQNKV